MSVTQTDDTNINPRLAILVKLDDPDATDPEDTAVSLTERDSITIELNEENADFEGHSRTDVITNPTTQDPQITLSQARAVSGDALEAFGVVDTDGNYQRDGGRTWEFGCEIWYFEQDVDVTSADPAMTDTFGAVRWDVGSFEPDGNTVMYDLTGHVENSNDISLGSAGGV